MEGFDFATHCGGCKECRHASNCHKVPLPGTDRLINACDCAANHSVETWCVGHCYKFRCRDEARVKYSSNAETYAKFLRTLDEEAKMIRRGEGNPYEPDGLLMNNVRRQVEEVKTLCEMWLPKECIPQEYHTVSVDYIPLEMMFAEEKLIGRANAYIRAVEDNKDYQFIKMVFPKLSPNGEDYDRYAKVLAHVQYIRSYVEGPNWKNLHLLKSFVPEEGIEPWYKNVLHERANILKKEYDENGRKKFLPEGQLSFFDLLAFAG